MENVYWGDDEFEDVLTKAFVALDETRIVPDAKLINPIIRCSSTDYERLKRKGLYFAARDRIAELATDLDFRNDGRQVSGGVTVLQKEQGEDGDSLLSHNSFRLVPRLPIGLIPTCKGDIYEIMNLKLTSSFTLAAIRSFVVVDAKGVGHSPLFQHPGSRFKNPEFKRLMSLNEVFEGINKNIDSEDIGHGMTHLSLAYSGWADRIHTWQVETECESGNIRFGVYEEEVKSLFYSRDLPVTAKGNKRPIMHWVKAHKRRMRNGTDIEISNFLRGTESFVFDGMKFSITQPIKKNSLIVNKC